MITSTEIGKIMDEFKFKQALEDRGLTWEQAEMVLEELDLHDNRGEQLREAERIIQDLQNDAGKVREDVSAIRYVLGRIANEEDDDLLDLEGDLRHVEELLNFMEE